MQFGIASLFFTVLLATTSEAKACGATWTAVCANGHEISPIEMADNFCQDVCTKQGGMKSIKSNKSGGCSSYTAYGLTGCRNSYHSTADKCERHHGLTAGDAHWYSFRTHC